MKKRSFNIAFIFAIAGIFAGAFYREFTQFLGFTGETSMSLVHTHLLALGTIMFMLLTLSFKVFDVEETPKMNRLLVGYTISVIGNAGVMFVRGLFEVMNWEITRTVDMTFAGISGIIHILLTITLIWILNIVRKSVEAN